MYFLIEEQNRPFMTLNLDTPSPTAYDPPTNPPNMTTFPAYTMRPKTYPEKGNWLILTSNFILKSKPQQWDLPMISGGCGRYQGFDKRSLLNRRITPSIMI